MLLEYKGYRAGPIETDQDTGRLSGTVVELPELVFSGQTRTALKWQFRDCIDAYLQRCADQGKSPKQPMHPAIANALEYFWHTWDHDKENRKVWRAFERVGKALAREAPRSPETTVALRKLLEAKDSLASTSLHLALDAVEEMQAVLEAFKELEKELDEMNESTAAKRVVIQKLIEAKLSAARAVISAKEAAARAVL